MPTKKPLGNVQSPANDRFKPRYNWATGQMDDPVDKLPAMKPMPSHTPAAPRTVTRPVSRKLNR